MLEKAQMSERYQLTLTEDPKAVDKLLEANSLYLESARSKIFILKQLK
jgi:hypothetical protein